MTKYIALIRGINVGGNGKVSMPELKRCLENVGFSNISTYINSGNIIFEHVETDMAKLVDIFEVILEMEFNVKTRVAVITVEELHDAMAHVPMWWGDDKDSKHNVVFVIAPADPEVVMKSVGELKPEFEKVERFDHVIFWSAPIKTFGRSRWAKIVGTAAYKDVTIRNANTARKLVELTQ